MRNAVLIVNIVLICINPMETIILGCIWLQGCKLCLWT